MIPGPQHHLGLGTFFHLQGYLEHWELNRGADAGILAFVGRFLTSAKGVAWGLCLRAFQTWNKLALLGDDSLLNVSDLTFLSSTEATRFSFKFLGSLFLLIYTQHRAAKILVPGHGAYPLTLPISV